MNNEEIRQRVARLEASRSTVQDTWDEIERYIAPYRGRFFKDQRSENSVEWRRPWIYDSTAVSASQSLAAHVHSSLTSPQLKWFDLRFRLPELNEDNDAIAWLDQVGDIMYKALQDSNFTVEAGETYQDLVDFGTSIIVEEHRESADGTWQGVNFTSIPLKEAFFEQNFKGEIENFYRRLELTAIQIVDKFGDMAPDGIKDDAEDPVKAEIKHNVIFAVYKRKSVDVDTIDIYKPIPVGSRPYGYRWILEQSAESLSEEGGYYEMPAYVPRWRKTSGSMWGNSPAMIALADTLTLNKLVEMQINAMEKVIDPATITTERGLIGDLDLNPGGLTVVRSMTDLKPFESAARFDVSYQEISRYRDQIREYFMIDQLMLPPMEGTPATATEIAARVSQLERLIGPTLGRLQIDFLDPCIQRTFNILVRAGVFPEPPESVMVAETGLDVEYVGALARSQQQDQVNAVDRWLFQLTQLASVNPEVLDVPDWTKILKGTAHAMGVPAKYLRSDAEIKADREARQEQEAQMAEAQLASEQAGAAANMAKAGGMPSE